MAKYYYNKELIEFYTTDGSTVQAWQVEWSNIWTIEVFPENQSKESFERGQFSGSLDIEKKDFTLKEYPENWTDEDKETFKNQLFEEIKQIELVDKEN